MTRHLTFVNEKGGSCKTTLTLNVGAYLALRKQKKVLLVDMDPQGQIGKGLGFDVRGMDRTVFDFLTNPDLPPEQVIRPSRIQGLDIIVANKALVDFPLMVAKDEDRVFKLRNQVSKITSYDYIFFDSPPSLGLITINIMLAASEIIIPVSLTYFALDGCAEILDTVNTVKKNFQHDNLAVTWVVPALYRKTKLADSIIEKLKSYFPGQTTRTVIGYSVKIDEAQSYGQTIWEYAPSSRAAQMMESLCQEIL